VYQWQTTGIPPARLPAVERITGIPMRELRPDLWEFQPAGAE
jgi:DNA-binding transcriptional regulator YdaS (Cro superfamily)